MEDDKAADVKTELEKYVDILRDNCLYGMNKLLFTCNEWAIEIPKKFKPQADLVMNSTELTEEVAHAIQELWECDFIESVFERSNEIQLPGGSSGTAYYIKHALRFAKKDYVPTPDDVIRALNGECKGGRGRRDVRATTEGIISGSGTNFPKIEKSGSGSTAAPKVPELDKYDQMYACVLQTLPALVSPNGINFGAFNRRLDILNTDRETKKTIKDAAAECIKITPKDKKSDVQVPIFSKCAVEKLRQLCPEYFA